MSKPYSGSSVVPVAVGVRAAMANGIRHPLKPTRRGNILLQ